MRNLKIFLFCLLLFIILIFNNSILFSKPLLTINYITKKYINYKDIHAMKQEISDLKSVITGLKSDISAMSAVQKKSDEEIGRKLTDLDRKIPENFPAGIFISNSSFIFLMVALSMIFIALMLILYLNFTKTRRPYEIQY